MATSFKGFTNIGFAGFGITREATPVTVNNGLAMPAYVDRGVLGNEVDGRKLAIPPYDGAYVLLPNCGGIADSMVVPTDFDILCYNANGTVRWSWSKSNLTTSGTNENQSDGYLGFWLDTLDSALYVLAVDSVYNFEDLVLVKIDLAAGTVTQYNGNHNASLIASPSGQAMFANRHGLYFFRDGMGTGNFIGRKDGGSTSGSGVLSEGSVGTVNFFNYVAATSGVAHYESADGKIFVEGFNSNGKIYLRRGSTSGNLDVTQIPGGVPSFSGGQTGTLQGGFSSGGVYPVPTGLDRTKGIWVTPWGDNQVALAALSTESIFGQRYYKRNEFDAWLNAIANKIGLPAG